MSGGANTRVEIPVEAVLEAIEHVKKNMMQILARKGYGSYASNHEIYGILAEEVKEYLDEIHLGTDDERKVAELVDIAVTAIFGIACITEGGVDW